MNISKLKCAITIILGAAALVAMAAEKKPFVKEMKKRAANPPTLEQRAKAIKPVKLGKLRLEPMFASVGITYGSPKREDLKFQYRKASGGGEWQDTYAPFWFDEFENYRGMAWKLDEDTEYELRVVEKVGGESRWREVASGKFRTWASVVPIAKTVYLDENTEFPLTISDQGTAEGWVRYTTKPGVTLKFAPKTTTEAMIIVNDAKYLVLDDMKLVGGDVRSVVKLEHSQYVRVRNCNISGWGHLGVCRFDDAGRYHYGYDRDFDKATDHNGCNGILIGRSMRCTVVERCFLHDPVARSTTWRHAHPYGAFAIGAARPDHSTSLRYNDIVGSDKCRWDDCVGGYGNFIPDGGFNRTAEIYGNLFIFSNDDGIELDGGQQNLACWGNRFEGNICGASIQGNVVSPSFVFENLFAGLCEERGETVQTVKTSGYDIFGQGPFSAVLNNVFYARGNGINVSVLKSVDPNKPSSNAGRVGGIDVIGNTFCGKQTITNREGNPKGVIRDNVFGAKFTEKDLDRGKPYRPIPFLLDTCIVDVDRDHSDRQVGVEKVEGVEWVEGRKYEIVKCDAFDWFEVEPKAGVLKDGMKLTVKFKPGLKDFPIYRGAFLVRTEDGFSRPVSVYARTGWTQPEKCDQPGTIAVYAHPKDGVKDAEGFTVYTFEAPKDGRYYFHVFAQADQRPTALAAVDDETPDKFTVLTCWQYPVWSIIHPGKPQWSIRPGRISFYDLKAGKHTLRVKALRGKFKPLAYVMTDNPLDFEPLIDFATKE